MADYYSGASNAVNVFAEQCSIKFLVWHNQHGGQLALDEKEADHQMIYAT